MYALMMDEKLDGGMDETKDQRNDGLKYGGNDG